MSSDGDRITLCLDAQNKVVIHKFGATVLSWLCNGKEVLFLSEKAVFDNKKAIRGGIPIVFPNFGPWEHGPQHGFARISMWELSEQISSGSSVSACFSLTDSDFTRSMWDYKFKLLYTVTLSQQTGIACELKVENTGDSSFDFTTLLHTYIRVNDIEKTTISNLTSLSFIDKLRDSKEFKEENSAVSVTGGADRVYISSPNNHVITDTSMSFRVNMQKTNLPDTVVWNPWRENAAKMADFGEEEYKQMVCVEPGAVTRRTQLPPGQIVSYYQIINLM